MKYANYKKTRLGITKDGHTMFEQDIVSELNRKSYLEQQLEQYKSIVKTVDADNLPEGEVLCIGDFNRLLFGQIDYCTVGEELFVFKNDDVLSNPTHYIEIEELINLFNGASK